jgi:23S rRNA pseudouridine1911/1915/1917 synthase
MQNEQNETIIITDEESGERLDKILANRYKEVRSRTYFQFLIEEHKVLLNGQSVKKRFCPQSGDEVEVFFTLTPEIDVKPEPIPLDILFEDDDLLAINKPAGMVVHPAPGNWSGTFVNALLHHCRELDATHSLRPGIVHRLDKDTSGVLIAAKNSKTQQRLIEMFAGREIYKEYLAICVGNPGNQEVNKPIGRHPVDRKKMAVIDEGRAALTLVETLAFNGKLSLVKVVLATGRTHQIRVHMKSIGTPVLGDSTYGNAQANQKFHVERQMLHAKLMKLKHPITHLPLTIEAPIPVDMKKYF